MSRGCNVLSCPSTLCPVPLGDLGEAKHLKTHPGEPLQPVLPLEYLNFLGFYYGKPPRVLKFQCLGTAQALTLLAEFGVSLQGGGNGAVRNPRTQKRPQERENRDPNHRNSQGGSRSPAQPQITLIFSEIIPKTSRNSPFLVHTHGNAAALGGMLTSAPSRVAKSNQNPDQPFAAPVGNLPQPRGIPWVDPTLFPRGSPRDGGIPEYPEVEGTPKDPTRCEKHSTLSLKLIKSLIKDETKRDNIKAKSQRSGCLAFPPPF